LAAVKDAAAISLCPLPPLSPGRPDGSGDNAVKEQRDGQGRPRRGGV
jgi:hypothetical protein